MKKVHFLTFLFMSIFLASICSSFVDYPDNPPNGYTGSGAANCGNCHSGGNFGGTVVILGVPAAIVPNTTYSISVTTAKTTGSSKKAGFQLNVLNGSGATSGTLSSSVSNVRIESGYAEQAETSTFQNFVSTSGPAAKTWTFDWTSPASSANSTINFYVCSVIANGTGSTSGDQVVLNTATGTFSAPLTVTQIAKTNVSCNGGSNGTATVNASGGSGCSYTYSWSNGQNSQTATGLSAGTYTVTATCGASSGTTSVSITQPATPLTLNTTGSSLICSGVNNGTVSASASGGGTTYSYLWSNNQTGPNLSNLAAGTYTVTVSDNNGCTQSKSATVSNPSNSVSATATASAATCINSGTASVSAINGTSPYTYLWSNGQSDATAVGLAPNTYVVTVTDNNGCKTTATATVNSDMTAPPASITGISTLTCTQTTGTLSGPIGNFNYLWSTAETTSAININSASSYTLTVTDKNNGCTSASTKIVNSNTNAPVIAFSGSTNLNCTQPVSVITASGGNSYQWSGPGIVSGANAAAVTINSAGDYNVTVTNSANGCTNSAATSVTSDFNPPIIPNITPLIANISCSNSFVTLTSSASDALLHQWKLNGVQVGTGRVFNAVKPGTYTLVLTNLNNGCSVETTKVVNSSSITLSVTAVGGKLNCVNTNVVLSATASGAVSYSWTSTGFSSALQNPSVSNPGTYTVVATDVNGCTGTAQATVLSDTQKPVVTASASGSISCSNPAVTLTATSSTPNLNFSWSSNTGFSKSGNPVVTQQSGDFTVTAINIDNGCTGTAVVKVSSSNDKPILSTSAGTITCKDSIVDINVIVSGNTSGLIYKWIGPSSFSSTKSSDKVTVAGDYNLTVTASNGCSSTAFVSVKQDRVSPNVSIESSKLFICSNDTLVLSAKSGSEIKSFSWSDNTKDSTTKIVKSGLYKVTITGANGCTGTSDLQITDGKTPEIVLSADSLTCAITKIIPNAIISWDVPILPMWTGPNGFTSSILQPEIAKPGQYILSVNPSNGCPASKEVTIKENKVAPTIQITGTTFNCDSIPLILVAGSSVNTYLWKGFGVDNLITPNVTAKKTGRYYCFTLGKNGCSAADSIDVTIQNPPFEIDSTKSIVINAIGNMSNGSIKPAIKGKESNFSYKWSNGISGSRNLIDITAGRYCLTITDPNGCSSNFCFNVKSTISTSDKNIVDLVDIKPNPVTDILYLSKKTEFKIKEMLLFTDKGQLMLQYFDVPEQIDLISMPAGMYFLKIEDENGRLCFKKLIKI